MLRNYSIGFRISAIIAFLVLTIAGLVGAVIITGGQIKESGISSAQTVMMDGEKAKIRLGTETIAHALGRALSGITDPGEQAAVISRYINDIRFESDKSGYYFVYKGTEVFVHPVQPSLVGKDLGGVKDEGGVAYVSDLHRAARDGGGFVEFIFGKPRRDGSVANAPKLAYAMMIPGTELWVATGIYIDNIDAYKAAMDERLSSDLMRRMALVIGVVMFFVLFLLLPLCVMIVRSISRPLRQLTLSAEQIANGSLDVALNADGRDEVSMLQASLARMVQNIRASFDEARANEREAQAQAAEAQKAVLLAQEASRKADAANAEMMQAASRLEEAAHEMETFANSISHSTAGVKEGTSTQDTRIRKILAAIEQLSSSVLDIARSASSAARQAEESRAQVEASSSLARESGQAMAELRTLTDSLTGNIHKLGEQSQSIGQVMSVINDIADQTNLLALNAAIEAARAGDAGRGFAVVADEVRKLAEKTMQATHEVRESITSIQELTKVNITGMDGALVSMRRVSDLSEETVSALGGVQEAVREATAQVQAIAAAVEQQSASSSEVAALVGDVSNIASDNAELVVKADNELRGLVQKSGELLELVSRLRQA